MTTDEQTQARNFDEWLASIKPGDTWETARERVECHARKEGLIFCAKTRKGWAGLTLEQFRESDGKSPHFKTPIPIPPDVEDPRWAALWRLPPDDFDREARHRIRVFWNPVPYFRKACGLPPDDRWALDLSFVDEMSHDDLVKTMRSMEQMEREG